MFSKNKYLPNKCGHAATARIRNSQKRSVFGRENEDGEEKSVEGTMIEHTKKPIS